MGEVKKLFVSYSSMSGFRKCPRYYWYKHIKRLEKVTLNIAYIVGRIMHHGIQTVFSSPANAEKELSKKYREEAQKARKQFPEISVLDEEDLVAQEFVTKGMLRAFRVRYNKFLLGTKHISTEKAVRFDLNERVVIVGKIDNIIENQQKRYLYELKNLKHFDMERIDAIKTDPQTSLYFEIHNRSSPKSERLDGILYQINKKPGIRQKQKESRIEFLQRLEDWYLPGDSDGMKMHMERLNKPFIDGEKVINTVEKVTQQMLASKTQDDFYQDFNYCVHDWGQCQFYKLCHEGETPQNLKSYTIRPKYSVEQEG